MIQLNKHSFSSLYSISSGISTSKEQAGHGSPFLSFSTVFNNYFIPSTLIEKMDTTQLEQETFSIKEGDIFLTRTSEVLDELAMSSVCLSDIKSATYSGFLKRLRPIKKNATYPKFMAFYLRSPLFRKTITNNAVMTLRASFNEAIFSYLDLYLPSYQDQVRIGDFLYRIYQKIEINKKQNIYLSEMANQIYAYWFKQFDFPDNNGNPYKTTGGEIVYNPIVKRFIPKDWGVTEIGKILGKVSNANKVLTKNYQTNGMIPIVDQSQKLICGFTDNEENRISPLDAHVVFGDHTRIVKLVNFDYARGADGTQIMVSKEERIPNILLYHSVLDIDLSNYGYARHYKFLKEFNCLLPTLDISIKFNNQVNPLYQKIKCNILQNIELQKSLDWLLPMLMNGQISIKEADEHVAKTFEQNE